MTHGRRLYGKYQFDGLGSGEVEHRLRQEPVRSSGIQPRYRGRTAAPATCSRVIVLDEPSQSRGADHFGTSAMIGPITDVDRLDPTCGEQPGGWLR